MTSADVALSSRPYFADPSALNPVPATGGIAGAANDELEDILNYDAQIDNVFNDVESGNSRGDNVRDAADPLQDVDEEVKVRKKRAPVAKLDEERLLGPNGIPKLRRITKERLKLKGKGHEFSDIARLLGLYQMWLDDLFPKASFADGLAIIEKLGHKRRMQVMRQEWINEGRTKPVDAEGIEEGSEHVQQSDETRRNGSPCLRASHSLHEADRNDKGTTQEDQQDNQQTVPHADELDMLLASDFRHQSMPRVSNTDSGTRSNHPDDFGDDEEAMRGIW